MKNSHQNYVIQYRLQDYWLDFHTDSYVYLSDAKDSLSKVKNNNPEIDFRLVKRFHTYTDVILNN
jgi:hypothetical protein